MASTIQPFNKIHSDTKAITNVYELCHAKLRFDMMPPHPPCLGFRNIAREKCSTLRKYKLYFKELDPLAPEPGSVCDDNYI